MPTFYHGTHRAAAIAMAGPPGTIARTGSGEFGRGFYMQDSNSNALSWVQNRFSQAMQPCVLKVDIADQPYANLGKRILDHKRAKRLTAGLRAHGTTGTHTEGVDVVVGPLNGSNYIQQQKFESLTAETLLNGVQTQRRVI
jgi:hypothetical protein